MCCFSRPVLMVSATRIFARPLDGARQLLVYGMTVDIPEELAMVLPIPVTPRAPDDAVTFVDLSSCPTFLADLSEMFPKEYVVSRGGSFHGPPQARAQTLVVHDVGDFEASFVPTQKDFDRLDERFRLPSGVFDSLPRYADWGFCVFKLAPKKSAGLFGLFGEPGGAQTVHPMAFEFPRRDASTLFFPTVHVHDGEVHDKARFDHDLFCQAGASWTAPADWSKSEKTTDHLADRARKWAAPGEHVYKRSLHGELANEDVLVTIA